MTMRGFFGGRAARHRRWQSVLSVAAIAAAVALPVVLISVGGGVADHELASLRSSGYQIVVSGAGAHGIEDAHKASTKVEGLTGVRAASPILTVAVDAFNRTGAFSGVLGEGVVPGSFALTLGPAEQGLFPIPLPLGDPTDALHWKNGTYGGPATWDVLVSTTFAQSFRVAVGDQLVLSPTTDPLLGISFNVTGLFGVPLLFGQPSGAYAVLVPLSDLQVLVHLASGAGTVIPDAADTIEVVAEPSVASDTSALAALRATIQGQFRYYTVTMLSEEARQLEEAASLLTGFYLALSSVGLTVGVMFLALVLLRRVEADRRSIGIRRALGVPGRRIVAGIVEDGAVLAAAGGGLGVAAGWAVVRGLERWATSTVQQAAELARFDPGTLAMIVLGVVGLSLLASLLAARRALSVDVLEALR